MNLKNAISRGCLAAAVTGAPLLAGCTHETVVVREEPEVRTVERIVVEAPPTPRVEQRPVGRSGYVWIDGYYRHNGRQYVWVPGRYERLPRQEARWVPGRWDRTDRGYIWIEGRWD